MDFLTQLMSLLMMLCAFVLLLVVPTAVYELWKTRVDREWIRRLRGIERGRKQQEAEYGASTSHLA